MFFYLSKIIWMFVQPTVILCALNLACAILIIKRPSKRRKRVGLVALGLFICCAIFPFGTNLIVILENRFPARTMESLEPPDGIIVLSGAESASLSVARKQLNLNEAAERLLAFALLAHRFPNAELVFTGSSGALFPSAATADKIAEQVFGHAGIPSGRIRFERSARNTFENAQYSFQLVQPTPQQRWLLITSASHMPRAMGAFRQQGWEVIPFPVDFKTLGTVSWRPSANVAYNFVQLDRAVHEWLGLLAYRATGKSSAFFPKSAGFPLSG